MRCAAKIARRPGDPVRFRMALIEPFATMTGTSSPDNACCSLSRRADGAILVRMPSRPNNGHTLPDAVFAFRLGDPQYHYWEKQLQAYERKSCA